MLKSAVRKLVARMARSEMGWKLIDRGLRRIVNYAAMVRHVSRCGPEYARLDAEVMKLCPDLLVVGGPFAGMRYPSLASAGSALAPKLLGQYERELQEIIAEIIEVGYSEVIDVGSAEGYYAVGLAMVLDQASVHAFDTDERARGLCAQMAELNGVADRIQVGGLCTLDNLLAIPVRERALIVMDCEGGEAELLDHDRSAALMDYDILVETHDLFDMGVSCRIKDRYRDSHDIRSIFSTDDIMKAKEREVPCLVGYDLEMRHRLLGEGRAAIMEWLFLRSRSRGDHP